MGFDKWVTGIRGERRHLPRRFMVSVVLRTQLQQSFWTEMYDYLEAAPSRDVPVHAARLNRKIIHPRLSKAQTRS